MANVWGSGLWGKGYWNDLGSISITLSGQAISLSLGDETAAGQINKGWGRKTWGSFAYGIAGTTLVSGISLSTTLSNVTIDADIVVGWNRDDPWGFDEYGDYGPTVNAPSFSLPANLNSVSVDAQVNQGWGSDGLGIEAWGESALPVDVTGLSATFDIGTVNFGISGSVDLTGQSMTTASGTAEAFSAFVAEVSGFSLPMVLQYQEAVVDVTGFAMSMQEGDEISEANTIATVSAISTLGWNSDRQPYSELAWGDATATTLAMSMLEGDIDPAPDAVLTGIQMNMFTGTVSLQGDANTGTITEFGWGNSGVTWGDSTWDNGIYFDATSYAQVATISLGTAVGDANTIASITGQLMTMQEGEEGPVTGNATVTPTGINLTFSVGTVYNLIWNEVNTGTTSVWTEVDTAA